MTGRTMFEKIWERHVIVQRGNDALLFIDRNFVHEGSFHAFGALRKEGRRVRRPRQTFGVPDHYVPTAPSAAGGYVDAEAQGLVEFLAENTREFGFDHFGIGDGRQGIVHVIGPELGITQPGLTVTCGDSHTSTHGALGAYAFGIGATEMASVWALGLALNIEVPPTIRIEVRGVFPAHVGPKDLILHLVGTLGAEGRRAVRSPSRGPRGT